MTVDLSQRPIGPEGIEFIAAGLRGNTVTTALFLDVDELDVHNPGLQDRGAALLADALRENSKLEVLSMRNNHVGDDGVLAFAATLQKNNSLNQLNLAGNVFIDVLFDAKGWSGDHFENIVNFPAFCISLKDDEICQDR